MSDRKYVIINASEVSSIDFNQVYETSTNTLRYNNDNTQTFVKFTGDTPSFLNGKTQYTHSEILVILNEVDNPEPLLSVAEQPPLAITILVRLFANNTFCLYLTLG